LNTLDFSIWYVLQAEVQVTPYANLAALPGSFAMEWDQLGLEYICKTCHSFCHCLDAVMRKNCAHIEKMGC
jgi:hypothetical protein